MLKPTQITGLTLDGNWKTIVLKVHKKKYLTVFFFNKTYIFNFDKTILDANHMYYNPQSNGVEPLYSIFRIYSIKIKLLFFLINSVINYMSKLHWDKILFTGKGYKMYIKKTFFIYPKMGFSHKKYIYNFTIDIKLLNRTTMFVLTYFNTNVNFYLKKLLLIRKLNVFTHRGIRRKKQVLYKKVGKVSSY